MCPLDINVNPWGSLLVLPDTILYSNGRPPVLTAATSNVLMAPLLMVPRLLGVIQITSVSMLPVMVIAKS